MKNRFKFSLLRTALLAAAIIGLAGAIPAQAQTANPSLISVTNLPTWPTAMLTNGTAVPANAYNTSTNYIPIFINSGLAVAFTAAMPTNYTTNATGTAQIAFWPSVDGTNPISLAGTPWATLFLTPNITNAVTAATNWSQLTLNGYRGLFYSVSNNTSLPLIVGGTITNLATTNITPAGLIFSRPVR